VALDAGGRGVSVAPLHGVVPLHPGKPRWLLGRKRDRAAGLRVLQLIMPDLRPDQVEVEADRIVAASSERATAARFWTPALRIPILLALLIAFFNQLSGINAVLYFAPRIFEMTGLGAKAALLQSVGIGVTNLLFTFVGLWLIDRLGAARCFISGRSDTSSRWGSRPGRFSPSILPSCRCVSSLLSPLTR